jgi:DNA-binding GntR family transcriptional regulator
VSLQERIYRVLDEQLNGGAFSQNCALPTEAGLATRFGASRVTIRAVLSRLEQEGRVRRIQGRGTIALPQVAPGHLPQRLSLSDVLGDMQLVAQSTSIELLEFGYVAPPADVADVLGLTQDQLCQRAVRVRAAQGRALLHLTTYIPQAIGQRWTEADLARVPLQTLLARHGIEVVTGHQIISCAQAGPTVAKRLGVSLGAPLLRVQRSLAQADGAPVEYIEILGAAACFELRMSLQSELLPSAADDLADPSCHAPKPVGKMVRPSGTKTGSDDTKKSRGATSAHMTSLQAAEAAEPLRAQIVARLRAAITEGYFKPGTRLVERVIATQLEIGRPLLREAVRQLEAEGLVEVVPRRGPTVRALNPAEVNDLTDISAELEALCARYFVQRGTDADIALLRQRLSEMATAYDRGDRPAIVAAKYAFYEALIAGAHSEILQTYLRQLNARISYLWSSALDRPGRVAESLTELQSLVNAIAKRDADAAIAVSRVYVEHGRATATHAVQSKASAKTRRS